MNERLKNLRLIPEVNFRRAGGTKGVRGARGARRPGGQRAKGPGDQLAKLLGLIEETNILTLK